MGNEADLKKLSDDLAVIKSLLISVDEKPLMENWAFFAWAGMMLAGTVLHWCGVCFWDLDLDGILLRVWAPVLAVAIITETAAWAVRIHRESLPLLSRPHVRLMLSGIGMFMVMLFMIVILRQIGASEFIPELSLQFFATYIFLYAMIAYYLLYPFGYLYVLSGILLHFSGWDVHMKFYAAGGLLAVTLALAGIIQGVKEKKLHEK